ncbi:MAG TPA: sulfatase, partial [Verrucomicrobiales bacterium]|nr:sulfatase [Verrucomicrobiales bacterium]
MNVQYEKVRAQTRRHFFGQAGLGFGALALNQLLAEEKGGVGKGVKIPAKAKSIIYLHMAGSPSQIDLFENKPALTKFHGKDCPEEYLEGKRFAFIKGTPKMMGSVFDYQKRGESGQWVSDLLPGLSSVIDDVCVIRSMNTDQFNHSPAQLLLQTGNPLLGYPSMGSWVNYGLGSENKNLPGFVVLASGGKTPSAGKSLWGSGFLPTLYQGVQCRTDGGDPILYLSDPKGMSREARRKTLDALKDLNEYQNQHIGDPETLTRIAQYELSYRMQMSVPEVMDIGKEPQHVLDLYGAKPGFVSNVETAADPRRLYKGDDPTFANNCVLARRLVENGVRFVQLYDWGWDHHGSSPGESIDETLPIKCQQIDKAITGLIKDLKQRGLFDETLIVWGGEFGRTPMMQNNVNSVLKPGYYGRDHHPHAFTMWMAGAGIKPGAYGETDDIGYYIGENPVGIRDLQATILHLLGLDPHRFHFSYQGLNQRLIGP